MSSQSPEPKYINFELWQSILHIKPVHCIINEISRQFYHFLYLSLSHSYSHSKNLEITSEDDSVHELKLYKAAGGGSICDLTVTGIRIKPELLPKISSASNVHIICGTGYYVDSFIPDDIKTMEVSSIAEKMIAEIQIGIFNSNGVKCGVIGEIGCSWPLTAYEKKVLQAAAIAQTKTGLFPNIYFMEVSSDLPSILCYFHLPVNI